MGWGVRSQWVQVPGQMPLDGMALHSLVCPFYYHCRRLGEAIWGVLDYSIYNVTWAFADITCGGST